MLKNGCFAEDNWVSVLRCPFTHVAHDSTLSVSEAFSPTGNTLAQTLDKACRRKETVFCLQPLTKVPQSHNLSVQTFSWLCINSSSSSPSDVCILLISHQSHDRNVINTLTQLAVNSPDNNLLCSHMNSVRIYTDFVLGSWQSKVRIMSSPTDSNIQTIRITHSSCSYVQISFKSMSERVILTKQHIPTVSSAQLTISNYCQVKVDFLQTQCNLYSKISLIKSGQCPVFSFET